MTLAYCSQLPVAPVAALRLVDSGSDGLRQLWAAVRRELRLRHAARALRERAAWQLADIGIERHDIPRAVRRGR